MSQQSFHGRDGHLHLPRACRARCQRHTTGATSELAFDEPHHHYADVLKLREQDTSTAVAERGHNRRQLPSTADTSVSRPRLKRFTCPATSENKFFLLQCATAAYETWCRSRSSIKSFGNSIVASVIGENYRRHLASTVARTTNTPCLAPPASRRGNVERHA